jgi:hypothetical protein
MARGKFTWGPGRSARKCNKTAAYHKETGFALKRTANALFANARRRLAAHTHSGDSQILRSHGKLDYFVTLDDSRGQGAAAAIEFGHVAPDGTFVDGVHAITGGVGR